MTFGSLEEAHALRDSLASKQLEIQTRLGDRNKTFNGRRLNDREYWTWRQDEKEKLTKVIGQLREVKQWIRENSGGFSKLSKEAFLTEGENILEIARVAMADLWDYVKLLESRNRHLEEENEKLRSIKF